MGATHQVDTGKDLGELHPPCWEGLFFGLFDDGSEATSLKFETCPMTVCVFSVRKMVHLASHCLSHSWLELE